MDITLLPAICIYDLLLYWKLLLTFVIIQPFVRRRLVWHDVCARVLGPHHARSDAFKRVRSGP